MNILMVTPYFPPQTGGVVSFADSVQRLLRQKGHHVYVLLQGESHAITPCQTAKEALAYTLNMRVPWVPDAPIKGFLAFLLYFLPTVTRLKRFLQRNAIDIISIEYPLPYMYYFYILRLMSNIKLVVGIHGNDILSLHLAPWHEQQLVKHLVRKGDWLLAHSASLMAQADQCIGQLSDHRSYIPYGIEADRWHNEVACMINDYRVPIQPYILTVAKLHQRKALDILLHTIKKLGAAADGYHFVIVGDGPEEQTLRQLAAQLGIQESIIFTGELHSKEIAILYQHCEFFVLPSRSEPFGIVLLEAMTFGKAIITTNVGGIPEFVVDGYNGILVPSENSDMLAEQIKRMMRDRELRAQIGKNGITVVREKYDYQVIIKQYEELFHNVLTSEGKTLTAVS